jgi:D-arabinono-1,4-lactone oxidase/FAD binding domain
MNHFPHLPRGNVHTPSTEDEVRALISDAERSERQLRVVGSSHSVPESIADPGEVLMSLEKMRRVIAYDSERGRIEVEAGMTLGWCPLWPHRPDSETLGGFLEQQAKLHGVGWALPNLGGITHQTVGGFLSTGSSGGSVAHSIGDALESIRFIDGLGQTHDVRRGDTWFDAVIVSMGLCGVITRVGFRCEPWFDIIGHETTTTTADCAIDLFGDGPGCLREFLRTTPYTRLLWWPQPGVNKVVVWQARRMQPADYLAQASTPLALHARPYAAIGTLGQYIADGLYTFLGLGYGNDTLDHLVKRFTPGLARFAINAFTPINAANPTLFWDSWRRGLPMDNESSDTLMPTDFTELWIPIERTQEVMIALRDHYRDNGFAAAGTYAVEIYAAKHSPFFLSPAYGSDMVRIDVFWFDKNRGNAAKCFYPQFWSLLARFGFRPHWAKTLPPADSDTGVEYLRAQYPEWRAFLELRSQLDPGQVFVSEYWRRHLGIESIAVRSHSMVVPRAGTPEAPPVDRAESS